MFHGATRPVNDDPPWLQKTTIADRTAAPCVGKGMRCWCSLAVIVVACLGHATPARAAERITAVHIVSRAGDRGIADDTPKRALSADGVTLFAVLETADGGTTQYYSAAGKVRLGGVTRSTLPLTGAPPALLSWYKVEPLQGNLSNTASGRFRIERIEYGEVWMLGWTARARVTADVRPTLTPYRGGDGAPGIGTMRYQLRAHTLAGTVATPGAELPRARGRGGLDRRVHRVSLRRDDTYLGVLTEMFGQPYIWASAGRTHATHQSERLEGSDCADFVVFGWRRLGHDVPYTWTGQLHRHTRLLAAGTVAPDGVYRDRKAAALPYTRDGDLILFPRHVGVLVADRGVKGVLDRADIMMHTLFESPREQPIDDTGYADKPVEIRRWSR